MATVTAPYDLAGAEHDVDHGDRPPTRSYVLCSMPRSGSSLLSEALHATGALGTPIEYLDRSNTFAVLADRWSTPDLPSYVRALHRRRTTPDGLFGVKLHWFHLTDLAAGLAAAGVIRDLDQGGRRRAALDVLAPAWGAVLLTRRDTVGQAVSWFVADRTACWSSVDGRARADRFPDYDRRAIEHRRRLVSAGTRAWRRFLADSGRDVLEVVYEDLVADYESTVRRAARHLGVALRPAPLPPPRLRRQAGEREHQLIERFRAESERATTGGGPTKPFGAVRARR